jgi:hypothetical protein
MTENENIVRQNHTKFWFVVIALFNNFDTSFEAACVNQAFLHETGDAEELA